MDNFFSDEDFDEYSIGQSSDSIQWQKIEEPQDLSWKTDEPLLDDPGEFNMDFF